MFVKLNNKYIKYVHVIFRFLIFIVICLFQGILDVGMTKEDYVELIKTHTFVRKHATGTAKIELHILHVERGIKPL